MPEQQGRQAASVRNCQVWNYHFNIRNWKVDEKNFKIYMLELAWDVSNAKVSLKKATLRYRKEIKWDCRIPSSKGPPLIQSPTQRKDLLFLTSLLESQ